MLGCAAVALAVAVAAGAANPLATREKADESPKPPEIGGLIEQAESKDKTKAFQAILKLRDHPDKRAVPVLQRTLVKYSGTTYIHRFAAAQGLFCIGTKQAHQILAKHLLSQDYPSALSVGYTFHWNMAPPERDAFIERYHLRSTSKDLAIELKASSPKQADKQLIDFTLTLTNTSKGKLKIHVPRVYVADRLLFRSAKGRFVPKCRSVDYEMLPPLFLEMGPGASHAIAATGSLAWWKPKRWPRLIPEPGMTVLDCKDVAHFVGKPGRFKVYAVYSFSKASAQVADKAGKPGEPATWYGQVVSKPVDIEIAPAKDAPAPSTKEAGQARQPAKAPT
jgi:hypothetical protein